MGILDTFYILFDTDAKKAEREMADVRREGERTADAINDSVKGARHLAPAIDKAADNAGRLGRSFRAAGAVVAAGGALGLLALTRGFSAAVEEADRLSDAAARVRMGAQEYDTWRRSVKAVGGEMADAEAQLEQFDGVLRRIQADIGKRGVTAFSALGLSATTSTGELKDARTMLLEVSGAIEHLERVKKLAAIRRLGITDEGTIKLLLLGRSAVEALSEEQLRNGAITQEQSERIDRYKDSAEKLEGVLQGWRFALAAAVTPALTKFNDWLTKTAQNLGMDADAVQAFIGALSLAGGALGVIGTVATIVAGFGAAVVAWTVGIVVAIIAVAAAFALVYDDVKAFLSGQDSLIGNLMERYGWFRATINGLGVAFRVVWRVITSLADAAVRTAQILVSAFRGFYAVAAPLFSLFRDVVVAVWTAISSAVMDRIRPWLPLIRFVFAAMTAGIQIVGQVFGSVFQAIGDWWDRVFGRVVQGINALVNGARSLMGMEVSPNARLAASGVGVGQRQLAGAAASSYATRPGSVSNNASSVRNTTVNMGGVNVNASGQDPDAVSRALGSTFGAAAFQFDDGVAR